MSSDTGTGQVMTVEAEYLHNDEDWLACYIANMYEGFVSTPEWLKWVEETKELQQFLYATDTSTTSNDTNGHGHKTHRPKLTQLYDTLEANYLHALFPHDDWLQFRALDEESNNMVKRRKIEGYMRSRHNGYGHQAMATRALQDWMIFGAAVVETGYQSEAAQIINGVKFTGYSGPITRRLHPYRVAFNTQATSFAESPKIVQSIKTLGDIAKMIADERLDDRYREVLIKARDYRHYVQHNIGAFDTDWLDEGHYGFGTRQHYWCGDQVEILTFHGSIYDKDSFTLHNNRKIVIIDRKWILLEEDIMTPTGKPDIFYSPWRARPNSLLGMSPLQNLIGMQYYINHLENMRADAFDAMSRPDLVLQGIDDITYRNDGGTNYYIHENGAVRYLHPDPTILQADFKIEATERKMEEYAGAPAAAAGIKVPGEQTKFQFSQLNNAAGRLFQRKIRAFEDDILIPSANAELALAQQRLDSALPVEVTDDDIGERVFQDVSAADLQSDGGLVATGARHYALQAQLVQELSQFMIATAGDEQVKRHLSAKMIAKSWNDLLGLGGVEGIYEPNVRITEETEAQQLLAAAQSVLERSIENDPNAIAAQQADPTQGI